MKPVLGAVVVGAVAVVFGGVVVAAGGVVVVAAGGVVVTAGGVVVVVVVVVGVPNTGAGTTPTPASMRCAENATVVSTQPCCTPIDPVHETRLEMPYRATREICVPG